MKQQKRVNKVAFLYSAERCTKKIRYHFYQAQCHNYSSHYSYRTASCTPQLARYLNNVINAAIVHDSQPVGELRSIGPCARFLPVFELFCRSQAAHLSAHRQARG
jgi:hypothetical protein